MGMWPIARVNKPESDNPSSLESVELATDSSGPSEEPIRRSIVHFAWERGHLRRNPAMSLVMTLGVVFAVFCFDAAVGQEGYLGHDHDKWHRGFYQTLERPDTKSPCCNLTDCRPTSGR